MHEHAMIHALFRKLSEISVAHGGARIRDAEVWMGALCHISPEHFQEHFVFEGRGTAAEGAELHIEVSSNLDDPHAQDILLKNVTLELPDPPTGD